MLNRGFTLSEVLVVIIILSLFYFLQSTNSQDDSIHKNLLAKNISNDLLITQAESLFYREKTCFKNENIIAQHPICFNNEGNANMSQTIKIINSNLKITIFLGAGSHEIK